MAARANAPVIGALSSNVNSSDNHSSNHHLDVTVGYRFLHATTEFIGTFEEKRVNQLGVQPRITAHVTDVSVAYELNRRWSLTASIPFVVTRREQEEHPTSSATGIGDATIGARAWLFRGPTESGGNVSLGLSLKMPTGDKHTDPSVAAGDGAWGVALEATGYRRTVFHSSLYFSATYLFNPANTNGVFVNTGEESVELHEVSVTDQYLYRAGISHAVPKIRGLVATMGGRIQGVPVRDAFGRSDGFRRPGYVISMDPALLYSRGRNTFSLNVPIAAERNFERNVLDIAEHGHGDGSFADYTLAVSYTRHF